MDSDTSARSAISRRFRVNPRTHHEAMSARIHPRISHSFSLRLRIENLVGMLGKVLTAIASQKGERCAVDVVAANLICKLREGRAMHGELLAKGGRGEENPTGVSKTRKTVL